MQPLIEPLREKLGLPSLSLQDLQTEATQWAGQALAVVGSLGRRAGATRRRLHQSACPGVPDAGRDVLSAARLGEADRRHRRRLAARPRRHHPQARPRIERRHRRLCARPGAGLHLAGLDLRHRPVAGRPAVRPGHRPDRRRHLLHPLRRHLRRRRHGAGHGAGAVSAGLVECRQGRRGVPVRPGDGRQRAVAQAGRRSRRPASGLDHVRPAGRRLAVRLRRHPDRGADGGGDRRDRAPPARPLSRQRHLSRRQIRAERRWRTSSPSTWRCRRRPMRARISSSPPGNREALAWIDRWPDWPAPALALGGPAGCGKTHLGAHLGGARRRDADRRAATLEGKSVADLSELAAASRCDRDRACRPRAGARRCSISTT